MYYGMRYQQYQPLMGRMENPGKNTGYQLSNSSAKPNGLHPQTTFESKQGPFLRSTSLTNNCCNESGITGKFDWQKLTIRNLCLPHQWSVIFPNTNQEIEGHPRWFLGQRSNPLVDMLWSPNLEWGSGKNSKAIPMTPLTIRLKHVRNKLGASFSSSLIGFNDYWLPY